MRISSKVTLVKLVSKISTQIIGAQPQMSTPLNPLEGKISKLHSCQCRPASKCQSLEEAMQITLETRRKLLLVL